MKKQNFKNHPRYIFGFHVITFSAIIAALIVSIILLVSAGIHLSSVFAFLTAVSLGFLFFYTRQFATGNQDRVIRAEENARSYRITGKSLDHRLTKEQIIALRFADDSEYAELTQKALNRNLSVKDIKQTISQWRADHHRI